MYRIWCVEENGERQLVRDDVVEVTLLRALLQSGNHGAELRGKGHRYIAEPDPDAESTAPAGGAVAATEGGT